MLELCKEKEKVLQMLNTVIFNGEVYSAPNSALNSKDKNLNMVKLKKLLYNLGFKLTSIGTIFILEELAFFYNNGEKIRIMLKNNPLTILTWLSSI